jgi:hypothetical protein
MSGTFLNGFGYAAGSATDNSATDVFFVNGGYNQILELGGNLSVSGTTVGSVKDTATAISVSGKGVSDVITLNGGNNVLDNSSLTYLNGTYPGPYNWVLGGPDLSLTNSTVSYTVAGTVGSNIVYLDNVSGTNTIKLAGNTNTVDLYDAKANTVTFTGTSGNNFVFLQPGASNIAAKTNVVTATASIGGNTVYAYATTSNKVTLGGGGNNVTLNGNTTNTVSTGTSTALSPNTVNIGFSDDDNFGFKSTVTLAGSFNTVNGGDENFTISGGVNSNVINLQGDGNNTVTLTGTNNNITVWGGNNTLATGGSNAVVNILGIDGANEIAFVPEAEDPGIIGNPNDFVVIAGTNDTVNATYENVTVSGSGVTSFANINLGNGNNLVVLGGNTNSVNVGNGLNTIALTGNSNTVTVNDFVGSGNDTVTLGAGTNDKVFFNYAGGSVTGTAITGVTTVTQSYGAGDTVNVNLGAGTGAISLGAGSDTILANGNNTSVTVGGSSYGSFETITANGYNDTISVGDTGSRYGGSNITANAVGANGGTKPGDQIHVTSFDATNQLQAGSYSTITYDNGNLAYGGLDSNVVHAGSNNTVAFNNNAGLFGTYGNSNTFVGGANNVVTFTDQPTSFFGGNDYNSATVTTGSTVTFNSQSNSTDYFTVGAPGASSTATTVTQINGTSVGIAAGPNDIFSLTNTNLGSTLDASLYGNESISFYHNANDSVKLLTAASGDKLAAYGDNAIGYGNYSGTIALSGFDTASSTTPLIKADNFDFQGLIGGLDHNAINSFAEVKANWTQAAGSTFVHLQGGGQIDFANITTFTTAGPNASFSFSAVGHA